MGGETGGYLNCCQEFAVVKQDMDDPRTTYVPFFSESPREPQSTVDVSNMIDM